MSAGHLSRRSAIRAGSYALAALGLGATALAAPIPATAATGHSTPSMPPESGPHARTLMSWPTRTSDWGGQLDPVRGDLARMARTIAEYEPVVMVASPGDADAAQHVCGRSVTVIPIPVDNLWARDTFPKFVADGHDVTGVVLNFNGWGAKPGIHYDNDATVAEAILKDADLPYRTAPIVSDGGALESDGHGTMLLAESCLVNDNRNPGRSKEEIEHVMRDLFGQRKVIWFESVRGQDITDGHVDSLARFLAPGVVLLDRPAPGQPPDVWSKASDQARSVLQNSTDANGDPFTVIELPEADPAKVRGGGDYFLTSYVNYYVANGAVFVPQFGDRSADDRAAGVFREHFPGRDVVALDIDVLAQGDGGIHCSTQDQPA